MCDNISNLFQEALVCHDQTKQFQLMSQGFIVIIKGCKLVTDNMQQPQNFDIIANQNNLIKFMILSIPIFGQHIELILESLLEFYHQNITFMLNFWSNLGQLAQLCEYEPVEDQKMKSVLQVVKKQQTETYKNKYDIKIKTLKYIRLFINYVRQNEQILQNINIFQIFFLMIKNTLSDDIINQTCIILDQCRQIYGYQCFKSDIYTQIEDYLIKTELSKSVDIVKQIPNLDEKTAKQQKKIMDAGSKFMSKISKKIIINGVQEVQESFIDDLVEINKQQDIIKIQQIKNLEIWLMSSNKEKLDLNQSEFIQSFLKEEENFQIYLNFFMDPFMNLTSSDFKNFFKQLNIPQSFNIDLESIPNFRQHKKMIPNLINIYIYRSYKVLLSFIDNNNYNKLMKLQPNVVSLFFKNLYNTLQEMEEKPYILNINHIIISLRHILVKCQNLVQNTAVLEFCKNNFIFKLIEYLDHKQTVLFILDLLGVTNNCLIGGYQYKFWKYLQTVNFFCDLSKIMLIQDISQTTQKFDNNYMMTEIKIEIRNEKISEDCQNLYRLQTSVFSTNKIKHKLKNSIIYEDFQRDTNDIDQIYKIGCIQIKKTTTKDCFHNKQQPTLLPKQQSKLKNKNALKRSTVAFIKPQQKTMQPQMNSRHSRQQKTQRNIQPTFQSLRKLDRQIDFLDKKPEEQQEQKKYIPPQIYLEEVEKIYDIYPQSMSEITFCEMTDKKKKLFSNLNLILSQEPFSIVIANIFDICFKKIIGSKLHFLHSKDIQGIKLLNAILKPENSIVYKDLIENYLFKFDLNFISNNQNSSQICGNVVNNIIKNLELFEDLNIYEITINYFLYINKLVVKSMECFKVKNVIQMQDTQFHGGLNSARYQIIETFYLILKQANPEDKLIQKVYIPTWDCLILLYFEFRMNSIYQSLFLNIMKIVAEKGDDNILFIIFVKLNLFSKIVQTFYTIYQNNVLLTDNNVNEQFISLIMLCQLFIDNKYRFNHDSLNKINFWGKLNEIVKIGEENNVLKQVLKKISKMVNANKFGNCLTSMHTVL